MILKYAEKYSPSDTGPLFRTHESSGMHRDQLAQDCWRENTQSMAYNSKLTTD
jgi:hypothetical protein